jgi:hypothetical protein
LIEAYTRPLRGRPLTYWMLVASFKWSIAKAIAREAARYRVSMW